MLTPHEDRASVFPFGAFFGRARFTRPAGGFTLARLSATVPEAEVGRHTHEEAHLVLVTEGAYVTAARGAPALCEPPVLVYNPPGTTHRDRFRSDGGGFLTISVSRPALEQASEVVRLPAAPTLLTAQAAGRAWRLLRLGAGRGAASALAAEAVCVELLEMAAGAGPSREPLPEWLRRARDLLHDASAEALSMKDVAAVAGVHPVHLARSFRARFLMTPGDYLRRARLEKAASLLARGDEPLAGVALAAGFCDQSHLARAFRREYGMTPGEYRRSVRGPRRPG